MSEEQFHAMMKTGLEQAKAGQGMQLEDAFVKITEGI